MRGLGDRIVFDLKGVVGREEVDGLKFTHIFCNEMIMAGMILLCYSKLNLLNSDQAYRMQTKTESY